MTNQEQENKPFDDSENKLAELEEAKKQAQEYLDGWKRAKADLINYKREDQERAREFARYAKEGFLESILPLLDNMRLVEEKMPENLLEDQNVKGLIMIKTQLEDFLKNHGVEAFESMGKKFDPALHEVIQLMEVQDAEPGTIIEETEKGYMINDRLFRPAKVKVVK